MAKGPIAIATESMAGKARARSGNGTFRSGGGHGPADSASSTPLRCRAAAPTLDGLQPTLREKASMAQTTNRLFDDIARLMTDAAGAADGVRREIATVVKG